MPQLVPSTLLEQFRVTGTADIEPPTETRDTIRKTGQRISTIAKVCVDPAGTVQEATSIKASGFPDFDSKVVEQMHSWKFKPYEVNHVAMRVCSAFVVFYPKAAPQPTVANAEPEHKGGYWCITYTAGGVKSSGCGMDADYCANFGRTQAALQQWGMTDRSECEWQEAAWGTKVPVDGAREDWFFAERQHCVESSTTNRGTPCKHVTNGSAKKRR